MQDPTNSQNFNRYGYVLNNPLKYNDKDGEFWQFVIGAAISVVTNGFDNLANHQGFFKGAGKAALMGGIQGAFSFGIGQAAAGMSGVGKVAFQTLAHGYLGGVMSGMNGGSFGSGFLSGAAGSLAAGGTGALLKGINNQGLMAAGVVAAGAVTGGLGAELAGGNFWDGARNGAISAGLNHAMHMLMDGDDPKPKPVPKKEPELTLEDLKHLIGPGLYASGQRILALKPVGALGSIPGSSVASAMMRNVPGTLRGTFGRTFGSMLGRFAGTNGLGAALGRFAPLAGLVTTSYDFTINVAIPMSNAMSQYQQSNTRSGNWINNLPH